MEKAPVRADVLLRHGQILTMDTERRILTDGAIAFQAGQIVAVGPDRTVAQWIEADSQRDLAGALVHPGFIDGHVHTGTDLIRGFAPKHSADWSAVERSFFEFVGPREEYLAAMLSCMEMVANGTTLYCDTGGSRHLEETAAAIETVGMRGLPGYHVFDVHQPELEPVIASTDSCLSMLREQLERYPFVGGNRVRCAVTIAGMGLSSDRLLVEAAALAKATAVPMVMHQSWSEGEVASGQMAHKRRPIEHLAELGILDDNLTLVHMIHLDEREADLVAGSGARVIHCPAASLRRGMGAIRLGRFPEMLAAGVVVGLGSDGFSGKRDLSRQAYLAAVGFREMRGALPVLTAEQVLEMATRNGAQALGFGSELGSLEPGKHADVVVHTLDRPEAHPRFPDPVDNLVFFRQSQTVETVYVDGEAVFENGRFTRFDATEAYQELDAAAASFAKRVGPARFAEWPIID